MGPILFSLYVNDLPSALKSSKSVIYADDTALLFSGKSLSELQSTINSELSNISTWFACNKLTLNRDKTKYVVLRSRYAKCDTIGMQIHLVGGTIEQLDNIKYLGVLLDSNLNWRPHISSICMKLASACSLLIKCRECLNLNIPKIVYFSIFHCHITYCSESWSGTYKTYLDPIIRLQKRALRIMTYTRPHDDNSFLFNQLGILPFSMACEMKVAILINNILRGNHSLSPSLFIAPNRNTRSATNINFNLPVTRNTYGQRLLEFHGAKIWNAVPPEVKMSNYFTRAVKKLYLSKIS